MMSDVGQISTEGSLLFSPKQEKPTFEMISSIKQTHKCSSTHSKLVHLLSVQLWTLEPR